MGEEGQGQSIQARIAALNLGHVGRAPITANGGRPEDPDRPFLEERSQSTSQVPIIRNPSSQVGNEPNGPRKNGILPPPANIVRTGQMNAESKPIKPPATVPPRLPTRKVSMQDSPALPPRRPSDQISRKPSNESISSTISSISALSGPPLGNSHSRTTSMETGNRVKAPAYDPSSLPPLPPKRVKDEADKRYQDLDKKKVFLNHKHTGRARTVVSSVERDSSVDAAESDSPALKPSLPPRRPSRPEPSLPPRKLPPPSDLSPPKPTRSALSFGLSPSEQDVRMNGANGRASSPSPPVKPNGASPPPVPSSSRPGLSRLQATKPKFPPQSQTQSQVRPQASSISGCLLCRDFSAPDAHAAKFPRESVPSIDWLATQLTSPFTHSPTDQARCIFTWLHHNIAYDTVSFFNNAIQPSTPASTLTSGLAVCEGYAGLFTAIASKAGLESIVVGGHGKGYSFAPLKPSQPIPAEYSTHAWNAVKLDNDSWKLIDSCWGAGHVNGKNQPYTKAFSPRMFTMPNDEFGLRHFPSNRSHFFRDDGRQMTWEEYIIGPQLPGGDEPLTIYSGVAEREGISEPSILPPNKHLSIRSLSSAGPTIRFQFARICPHWSPTTNGPGKPYVFILAIHGVDGREKDYVPFGTNGQFWWTDVEPCRLGAPGQTVSLYTVESVSGGDARGLSVEEYRTAKGRKGMGFGGVAAWELI